MDKYNIIKFLNNLFNFVEPQIIFSISSNNLILFTIVSFLFAFNMRQQ